MEFLQNNTLNFKNVCRTCLTNNCERQHDIFQTPKLVDKFTVCTTLVAVPDDGYPRIVCESCFSKIQDFYEFQKMCLDSSEKLCTIIHSEKKPPLMELEIEKDLETDFVLLKETKQEKEDDPIFYDTSRENIGELSLFLKSFKESSSDDDASDKESILSSSSIRNMEQSSSDESDEDNKIQQRKTKPKIKKSRNSIQCSFVCDICNKRLTSEESLAGHKRRHEGLKPFPCKLCEKAFVRRGRLNDHIKAKHEPKNEENLLTCPEPDCERKYSHKNTLRKHIKEAHYGIKGPKQSFVCEVCGKELTSLSTLKNHRYLHNGKQLPFECPQCKKRYITNHKLKEHMNRHAGIRKFTCPYCGAKKTTRTELKTHINYHTKEKTYPCHICNSVFNSIGNFSRHKRIVHEGIKDYPCQYCEQSFGKAETRKHHEMTHTGEKPHECEICHKKFIQVVALKKHRKIHDKHGTTRRSPSNNWIPDN